MSRRITAPSVSRDIALTVLFASVFGLIMLAIVALAPGLFKVLGAVGLITAAVGGTMMVRATIRKAKRSNARTAWHVYGFPNHEVAARGSFAALDRSHSTTRRRERWRSAWQVAGVPPFSVVGYQYSLPFMGGTFEKPEAAIAADLAPLAGLVDAGTIFVSHSPAFGILDPGFADVQIGSRSLRQLFDSTPFLAHIHGHSHGGFGRSGKHFNVASGGRRRAMVLDTESMTHEVLNVDRQERDA